LCAPVRSQGQEGEFYGADHVRPLRGDHAAEFNGA
jgi:hypothetical protein